MLLKLSLQTLLLCKQVLHLTFKCHDPIREVVLLHGWLNLCEDRCLDAIFNLLQAFR